MKANNQGEVEIILMDNMITRCTIRGQNVSDTLHIDKNLRIDEKVKLFPFTRYIFFRF